MTDSTATAIAPAAREGATRGPADAPEANKAVVRRFVDEFQTAGRLAAADELIAPDFVDHSPAPGMTPGRDGVKQLFAYLRTALPDFRATIHDQVAEGDKVVTRKTFSGTQQGELFGVPPTGKPVAFTVIDIVRVRDGQIVEHWNVVDQFALMQQLGALPS